MRYLPSLLLAALTVGMAPFLGKLQKVARDALEVDRLVLVLTVAFALGALLLVSWVLTSLVRDVRRSAESSESRGRRRLGFVVAGCLLVAIQVAFFSRGSASTAAYERLHFVLYGLLGILLFRAFSLDLPRRWGSLGTAAGVVTVSILDEGLQWLVPLRTGEIFDLWLNLYGGLAGLLVAQGLPAQRWLAPSRRTARAVALLVVAAFVLLAAFVDRAHLGHVVADPEFGRFRSFFDERQLARADQERRRRWAERMPELPLRRALEIEDYFLTEAAWHVRLRNHAREAGDLETAWHEDRILRRFYSATLEIPNGTGWYRYRLTERDQRRLDAYEPRSRAYTSNADGGRIWPLSRNVLLLPIGFGLLAGAILWRRASAL